MKKIILSSLLLSSLMFANDSVDYTFSSGEVIRASEINANFSKLSTLITELRGQIDSTKTQTTTKQLVGFTPSTMAANSGVIAMNQACNQAFTDSMMCTSEDIINSISTISDSGTAWIKPVLVPYQGGSYSGQADISGYQANTGSISCRGWSSTTSTSQLGLFINNSGSIQGGSCASTTNKVACCK